MSRSGVTPNTAGAHLVVVSDVSRVDPAIDQSLSCGRWVFEVSWHDLRPREAELSRLLLTFLLASLQVHHLEPGVGQQLAAASSRLAHVHVRHGDGGAHLRHPVTLSEPRQSIGNKEMFQLMNTTHSITIPYLTWGNFFRNKSINVCPVGAAATSTLKDHY